MTRTPLLSHSRQELRRDFNQFSAIAFNVILQGAWEVILVASTEGLVNGGVAGMFWSYVWTFVGMTLVTLSLAEMASMTPGPGGPYLLGGKVCPSSMAKSLIISHRLDVSHGVASRRCERTVHRRHAAALFD